MFCKIKKTIRKSIKLLSIKTEYYLCTLNFKIMDAYKHVFFDLDRTLWDFEENSKETLNDMFVQYDLQDFIPNFESFLSTYRNHNVYFWDKYRSGEIPKSELRINRFLFTISDFGNNDQNLAQKMDKFYITHSSEKTQLFPGAIETLSTLCKKYKLYIITNGFKEVQYKKIRNCNIEQYFTKIFTSEEVGYQKPNKKAFEAVLSSVNASKSKSIMIGDDIDVDIKGAANAGIDQIFFNPESKVVNLKPTHEIKNLREILSIL